LPTANAYKALGDIASNEQRYNEAKQYYAKAADNNSSVGKAAYSSLVKLDLNQNPGKYIRVRTGVDRSGRLVAELTNSTPETLSGITLQIRYPDSSGRIRQVTQSLRGSLKPGEKNLVNSNDISNLNQPIYNVSQNAFTHTCSDEIDIHILGGVNL